MISSSRRSNSTSPRLVSPGGGIPTSDLPLVRQDFARKYGPESRFMFVRIPLDLFVSRTQLPPPVQPHLGKMEQAIAGKDIAKAFGLELAGHRVFVLEKKGDDFVQHFWLITPSGKRVGHAHTGDNPAFEWKP